MGKFFPDYDEERAARTRAAVFREADDGPTPRYNPFHVNKHDNSEMERLMAEVREDRSRDPEHLPVK